MTKRVFNFGAGPCTLPLEALKEAQAEFLNFQDSGMSVIELSHRSKEYDGVHQEALALAKEIFQAPDEFDVLLIQGGASLQFAMIPMNLLKSGEKAGYVASGSWAKKAIESSKCCGETYIAWDGKENGFSRMPSADELTIESNTRYLHITSNETIGGIRFPEFPDVPVPLVADMSSEFMSRPIPWEKFDIVYGGAQKNLGPAGLGIVFIRKSILENLNTDQAAYLRYDLHADKGSLYNTPPVFPIYMMGLVLKWMKSLGGLEAIQARAEEKANLIYNLIDSNPDYFKCPVAKADRSLMNIVFRLPNEDLEKKFIAEAKEADLIGLKGHRSVGGCRASCYNAMPKEGVEKLVAFMEAFKKNN